MLRRELGETGPTEFETGLLAGLRDRLAAGTTMFPSLQKQARQPQARSVEAAIAAAIFAFDRGSCGDSELMSAAWRRVWRERRSGWLNLSLHPWESEASDYFGDALIAVAAGECPGHDTQSLQTLLTRLQDQFLEQPLHNRLLALWAAAKAPDAIALSSRSALLRDVWARQQSDGGWTQAALGPWKAGVVEMASSSDAFATAWVMFTLQRSGAACGDARLERGLSWLRTNQDDNSGAWPSTSMNKRYPAESMMAGFMSDAATGFAVAALLDVAGCSREPVKK
jgi:squalene-hopene/tetraprenyl-beta-curcumene cyclase